MSKLQTGAESAGLLSGRPSGAVYLACLNALNMYCRSRWQVEQSFSRAEDESRTRSFKTRLGPVGSHPAPVSRGTGRMDSMSFSRNWCWIGPTADPSQRYLVFVECKTSSLF